MVESDILPALSGRLDETAARVFTWAVRRGRLDDRAAEELGLTSGQLERATAALSALHLLRPAPDGSPELIATNPELAAAELIGPINAELQARQQQAAQVRTELLGLVPFYYEMRRERSSAEAIDVMENPDDVRAMFQELAGNCRTEVFSAHPGIGSVEGLTDALTRNLELLERGVRMRALYQHTVRVNPAMQHYASRLTASGCELRTDNEIVDRVVIVDREVAFIPRTGIGAPSGAVMVREPALVDYLYRSLEQCWSRALPFDQEETRSVVAGYGEAGAAIKRSIARMLADGSTDEQAARRLGMSVRTCRRHIAELMDSLGADSRFQAGVLAERSGFVTASAA
ncbi:LuxR C-terminal-related transcriptional regulator [Kitasatospora sp. NPDC047058]|uniref:helix-turn-helix transcriptional regulator n=1 Tax=Kitasatospora sp. NPDC047058 TaxID=3155620 RepID=UPI0033CDEDB1